MKKNIAFYLILFSFVSVYNQNNTYESSIDLYQKKIKKHQRSNQDSVNFYVKKATKLSAKNKDWNTYFNTYFSSNNVSLFNYNFNRLRKNIQTLDSVINKEKSAIDSLPNKLQLKNYCSYFKGFYYYRLNNYKKARINFKDIEKNTLNASKDNFKNNIFNVSVAYSYLALMYSNEGNYKKSIDIYKKNIRFVKLHLPNNKKALYPKYNLLGQTLKKEGSFNLSNSYLKKALLYFEKTNSTNSFLASSFGIAENYIQLKKIDSAKYFISKAKKLLTNKHIYNERFYNASAAIFTIQKKYDLAKKALDSASAFLEKKFKNKTHSKFAELNLRKGKLHTTFKQPKKALKNFNLALKLLDSLPTSTINKTLEFKILKNITKAENSLELDEETITTTKKATLILDQLKPNFKTHQDKLFLIENAFPLFENGIEANYKRYKKTKNKKYIKNAFQLSEKSKSVLLLESLLASKATNFANISKELIAQEQQLKAQITNLEKRINRKPTNKLKDALFDVQQKHLKLIEKIEKEYPDYYNLKYNTKVSSLDQIQDKTTKNQAVLSYFFGSKNLYLITILNNATNFEKTPITANLTNKITEYYKLISNPKSDLKYTQNISNQLLKSIFLEDKIKSKNELIIIPDGLLNYIPFGSLVTNNGSYLVESKSISYSNSATLLAQLQQKNNNTNLLAFAPTFKVETVNIKDRSKLLPLPHNTKEVSKIGNYFTGKTFTNNQATLKNFRENKDRFSIVHLATHAIFDDKNPEYSYLAFTSDESKDNLLYVSDIYNTKLNANLVTLSACETGIGNLKRGEGFIGLSRSFYYAGATSIAATLWKINDASTSNLMTGFYKNLSERKTKSNALQLAKINFLKANKNNALSHPYYWSGFIISGNNEALTSTNNWLWAFGGIVFFVMLYFLFIRKQGKLKV